MEEQRTQTNVKRRSVVKGIAWTVPAIAIVAASPAYAVSPPQGGCQRFAYAWNDCFDGPGQIPGSQVTDPSNLTCCPARPTWTGMTDSNCVQVTNGIRNGNLWVRMTALCGCYLASPGVAYNTGDGCSIDSNDIAGGGVYEWFEYEFSGDKVPLHFTVYVVCSGDECDLKDNETKVL